ncbi:flagellar basal body rod C-terminal domain-containing protein [Desulfovibrio sp.]|uniref:flagellar basal body rod C-terminal domain-containing protein n=1 Tax=Desulfovibrio sp. TaxID=885 RepID=UPI0025C5D407|nr:flagellar basal body rod C-terminal domain-containing protein [Desulfovibrio sp.]MCI7568485.1 flagellar basal-body rod protein [Desulfovibrio sp.]
MSVSSLDISSSALQTFGLGMMTTANAIANVNTDGFLPQRAVYGEMRGGGVRLESVVQEGGQPGRVQTAVERRAVTDAPSATELTREIPGMMTTQRAFEVNAVAVRTADEMLGTLLDIRA